MSSFQNNHYLFRVGDAVNLFRSSEYNMWGINSSSSGAKNLLAKVKPGDCLWFVKGNSKGLLVAAAIFERSVKRVNGQDMPFERLGWINIPGSWDTDIHFKNFKKIENMGLLSQIKSAVNPRIYNSNCLVNLPEIYSQIYPEIPPDQPNIIRVHGVNYLVTTNSDIQNTTTRRFIDYLVSSEESDYDEDNFEESDDDEDNFEELCEEKESLRRILSACMIVSDEIKKITSLLNNRLDRLDRLDRL